MMSDFEEELAALRARVAELERANPPAPPKFEGTPGPTTTDLAMSRMAMPPQAMRVMIEAIPDAAARPRCLDRRDPAEGDALCSLFSQIPQPLPKPSPARRRTQARPLHQRQQRRDEVEEGLWQRQHERLQQPSRS